MSSVTNASSSAPGNPLAMGLHYQLLQRAGSLIKSLDDLRSELSGLGELSFPQLIVVGEESSGKSSVLERIAMLKFFPRSDDLCTRMPIKLQLKHTSPEDMETFCQEIGQQYHDGVAFVRGRLEEKGGSCGSWSGFLPVDKVETLLQDEMDKATSRRYGSSRMGVVEDVLAVEVKSSRVPNLTLIDLPGTCVNPRKGEPEDIKKRTMALVKTYLEKEHTLVLLVMPALSRIHNNLGYSLVKRHNRERFTIGVLTKTDLAQRPRFADPYQEFKEQLDGRSPDYVELPHGYVAVRNRDSEGHESLEEAAMHEQQWFQRNLPGYIEQKKASSPVLVEKLVEMMCSYVENTWVPSARIKINQRLSLIKSEMDDLGPLREPHQLASMLSDIVTGFNSASGSKVLEKALTTSSEQVLRAPDAVSKPYPHGAMQIKDRLQAEAELLLENCPFIGKAVDDLLSEVAQMPKMKLSRFEFLFASLKSIISDHIHRRAVDSLDRFQSQISTVYTMFDSNPKLQRSSSSSWEARLHARVTALLQTTVWEELLFPLEELLKKQLRDNVGEWIESLVEHVKRTEAECRTKGAALEKLVEESPAVRARRQNLMLEEVKLKQALDSISQLKSSNS